MRGGRPAIGHISAARDWATEAACRGADTATWFPEPEEPTEAAKAVCRRCPVQRECLAYAVVTRQRYGVWGGLSEQERRRLPLQQTPLR